MEEAGDINNQLIDAIINIALQDSTFKTPSILYKYLSHERVKDVLGKGSVRFTPLSNTNDLFEVRAPFENFVGPKLTKMYEDGRQRVLSNPNLSEAILKRSFDIAIKKSGIFLHDSDRAFEYLKKTKGKKVTEDADNIAIKKIETELFPSLNSDEQTHKLFDAIGKKLCFSLSKRANISPMWAHYANHHEGFVIAFDTKSSWFKEWENGESKNLIKVPYFDKKMKEPLDNPRKAIFSKGKDWEYEREWRILAEKHQVDRIKKAPEEPIYLMNFPPEAVQRIILGKRIKPDVERQIKEIACAKYPHAKLHRMDSNLLKSRMEEVKV